MKRNRDDFKKPIKDALAKRVGFLCSNPNCRKLTIGANQENDKSTSIGIAAHITAAAVGGPRFDSSLSVDERTSIENGIWLCSNCAGLIDKDSARYSGSILKKWKKDAENESIAKLAGALSSNEYPFLEVDLIRTRKARINKGYSYKNPIFIENGNAVIDTRNKPIIIWEVQLRFNLKIVNNSNFPAINLCLNSIGSIHFRHIDKFERINNLPPLGQITLQATYQKIVECTYLEIDKILQPSIPSEFNKMILKLDYLDSNRCPYSIQIEFQDNEIVTRII